MLKVGNEHTEFCCDIHHTHLTQYSYVSFNIDLLVGQHPRRLRDSEPDPLRSLSDAADEPRGPCCDVAVLRR